MSLLRITAQEAASMVHNRMRIGFSGFTAAGAPKVIPPAIALRAKKEHEKGHDFKISILTGASTGQNLDGELSKANAVLYRTPYQSNSEMRNAINDGNIDFCDMHLSMVPQELRYGFLGKIDLAIIEAAGVSNNGEILLTSGVGISPTLCSLSDKIIIELNKQQPAQLFGIHDIYMPLDPPFRKEIPIYSADNRIGLPVIKVNPRKIVGIVETNAPYSVDPFTPSDIVTRKIGENVANFLISELVAKRIPKTFLPIQSGVGNIANAVLEALGKNKEIPVFNMYTEVIQDAVINLLDEGRCSFASGCSLTLSSDTLSKVYNNISLYKKLMILRPQEISNHPEIIRRLGIISVNTAFEVDIFGNVNSTHYLGKKILNGIGGSGDFTRNAYLSIFTCPSVVKNGTISSIVPMVTHADHNEHSVKIIITEQGIADLRGKSPKQKAKEIIENCVHPDYKQLIRDYFKYSEKSHTPCSLKHAFEMHQTFMNCGDMRLTKWE